MRPEPEGAAAGAAAGAGRDVRVWDLPTRLFHWMLAASLILAYVTVKNAERFGDPDLVLHRWTGYFILTLIVFRVIWGFAGSSTARFATFLRGPLSAFRYLRGMLRGDGKSYLGHNPLGAWMIMALLGVVAAQGAMGLVMVDHNEIVAGPLKRLIDHDLALQLGKLHVRFFGLILLLVAAHVLVNATYTMLGEPLIPAMISGTKPAEDYAEAREAVMVDRPMRRAAICFALSCALVLGGIVALGGRL